MEDASSVLMSSHEDEALKAAIETIGRRSSSPSSFIVSSCDPDDGCPDAMVVSRLDGSARVAVERSSMRPLEGQDVELDSQIIDRATSLCERIELSLGAPVSLELAADGGVIRGARWLGTVGFLPAPYRLVSLLTRDEGPIAPLAVDALCAALEPDLSRGVVRIFARAYRCVDGKPKALDGRASLVQTTRRAAEVALEATEPLGESKSLRIAMLERCMDFDGVDLSRLPSSSLGRALMQRRELVLAAERWLDRARASTGAAVAVLQATLGDVPATQLAELVAVTPSADRLRREGEIAALGKTLQKDALDARDLARVEELRARLGDFRPLGLDVRPLPFGHSSETLIAHARRMANATPLHESREAARAVVIALVPRLSPGRQGLVRAMLSLLDRLAVAKGEVADALAHGLLRLRACANEIGVRLVNDGVLEDAEGALYLTSEELESALCGEAVAFASRVRVRTEEDARFRSFPPPRMLAAKAY